MKVKNVVGTSNRSCPCGSWISHWEKHTGRKASICGERTCRNTTDLVGAHVRRTDVASSTMCILPLCKEHNQSTGEMEVYGEYTLAPEVPCK